MYSLTARTNDTMNFPLRRSIHSVGLLCALALLLILLKEPKFVVTLDPKTITSIGAEGVGYVAPLGVTPGFPYRVLSDKEQHNGSTLVLREDGIVSPDSHALHADIHKRGEGRYSHWGNDIYFSSRDNTDPRTNGHIYTVESEAQPLPWLLLILSVGVVSGAVSVLGPTLSKGVIKVLPIVKWIVAVYPFLIVGWCVSPPLKNVVIPVAEIQTYDGYGYVWQIPAKGFISSIQPDENQRPSASRATLKENNTPLLQRHADHYLIARNGAGRYSHWQDTVVFSALDNSDPRTNGKQYLLEVPLLPGVPLVVLALIVFGYQLYLVSKCTPVFRILVGVSSLVCLILALAATTLRMIPLRWDFPVDRGQIAQVKGNVKFPDLIYYRGSITYFRAPFFELNLETRPFRKVVELVIQGDDTRSLKAHLGKEEELSLTNPLEQFSLGFGEFKFALSKELGERAVYMRAPMAITQGGVWLLWLFALLLGWSWKRIETLSAHPKKTLILLVTDNSALLGGLVTILNILGLILPIGQEDLSILEKKSNFGERDRTLTWEQTKKEMQRLHALSDQDEVILAAAHLVSERIVHNWFYVNTEELRLQVPFTENWILWLRGEFLPNYRQYNFADYRVTLERGVGNCGQASMALIGLLSTFGVECKIWGFDGHTVVWAKSKAGNEYLLDSDYGVFWKGTFEEFKKEPGLTERYTSAFDRMGTTSEKRIVEIERVTSVFNSGPPKPSTLEQFHGADSSEFEKLAYQGKWVLPLILALPALILRRRVLREST